jgi:hypothetical protein
VTTRASGTFDVKLNPLPTHAGAESANLARMSIDKRFQGDLDAVSKGEMLSAGTSVKGSAGYVAIERVTGKLRGRQGSFVLQHTGTMNGSIVVRDTGAVIVVDYDVGQAFIVPQAIDPSSTDSGFIFSPVLRAADATRSGSIAGTVRAHSASGAPVVNASLRLYLGNPSAPEDTWSTLATARSDANGGFRFAYVTPSSYWVGTGQAGRTYIVAVDAPATSGLGRSLLPNVQVATGVETAVGTAILP